MISMHSVNSSHSRIVYSIIFMILLATVHVFIYEEEWCGTEQENSQRAILERESKKDIFYNWNCWNARQQKL